MDKIGMIMVQGVVSAALCAVLLCGMAGNGPNYAVAENGGEGCAVSAFAENQETAETKGKLTFDDSVWGDLARALERAISNFYQ